MEKKKCNQKVIYKPQIIIRTDSELNFKRDVKYFNRKKLTDKQSKELTKMYRWYIKNDKKEQLKELVTKPLSLIVSYAVNRFYINDGSKFNWVDAEIKKEGKSYYITVHNYKLNIDKGSRFQDLEELKIFAEMNKFRVDINKIEVIK